MSVISSFPRIVVAGEDSFIVYFSDEICESHLSKVSQLYEQLRRQGEQWITELIPSYNSLLVIYNVLVVDHYYAKKAIQSAINTMASTSELPSKLHQLPVWYGSEAGDDFSRLCEIHSLDECQLIKIHSEKIYRVFAIGFSPGFAFLGQVDKSIATPRLATPRKQVPAGAVGIADQQTAVYPSESPGGWNLIGRCPTPLFNLEVSPPIPFSVGDQVKFVPIDRKEYLSLGGKLNG